MPPIIIPCPARAEQRLYTISFFCSHESVKKKRLMLLAMVFLVAAGLGFYFTRPNEPSYQGRTLTGWLTKFEADTSSMEKWNIDSPRLADSVQAIRAIGTNGVPTIFKLMTNKDPPGAAELRRFSSYALGLLGLQLRASDDKRDLAILGFDILGKNGRYAIPRLVELARSDTDCSMQAKECLVGLAAEMTLSDLVQLMNSPDESFTGYFAEQLIRHYPAEAEKVGVYKKFPGLRHSGLDSNSNKILVGK